MEEDITLYAYHVREHEKCMVRLRGGNVVTPHSLAWKEEAAIAYQQRLLTKEECAEACFVSEVEYYENAFAHLTVFCETEYGVVGTEPVVFVIERTAE